jgi:hypothetical protein
MRGRSGASHQAQNSAGTVGEKRRQVRRVMLGLAKTCN